MRRIPLPCCACAACGRTAAAPPSSVMNERRFTSRSLHTSDRKDSTPSTAGDRCTAGLRSRLCRVWGHSRRFKRGVGMTASSQRTDISGGDRLVRVVPIGDKVTSYHAFVYDAPAAGSFWAQHLRKRTSTTWS